MRILPCELKDANAFIEAHHRHHKRVCGHRFSISAWDSELRGVAIIGRPVARMTCQRSIVEVTRLCTDGTKNACSALYSAAARIAKEMGYASIQTFILATETGVSLKASGWSMIGESDGGNWNCNVRGNRRTDQPMQAKTKWAKTLNH